MQTHNEKYLSLGRSDFRFGTALSRRFRISIWICKKTLSSVRGKLAFHSGTVHSSCAHSSSFRATYADPQREIFEPRSIRLQIRNRLVERIQNMCSDSLEVFQPSQTKNWLPPWKGSFLGKTTVKKLKKTCYLIFVYIWGGAGPF